MRPQQDNILLIVGMTDFSCQHLQMLTKDHSLLIGPNQLRNILSRRAERLRGVADKPTASNTPVVSADVRCMSGGPAVLLLIVRKLINCISSRRHEGLMTTTDSTS